MNEINLKNNDNNQKIMENNDMKDSIFLIDNPCTERNDSIGFKSYVDNLIEIVFSSDAKMIGLISNYGSGKSTVINMMENRKEIKNNEKVLFIKINLWNLPSSKEVKSEEDLTINIHKSFLNQVLRQTTLEDNQKKSLENKINKNYSFLDMAVEDSNFENLLFWLALFFVLIIITSFKIVSNKIPWILSSIIKFIFALIFTKILLKSKIYFSFNKESKDNRIIDEFETTECFIKIMEKLNNKEIEKVIICIEDIDRFSNGADTIRFLEQIYKFYSESCKITNPKVTFIVAIKPASLIENKESELENSKVIKINDEIKNIYEKIFDYIINLQPVAIQNYDSLIEGLLTPKYEQLKNINLPLPIEEYENIYQYLYRGKKNTIRDIKHRYNYAINLYQNLLANLKISNDAEINIETCFYVAYLEDEFSESFYHLINDSESFKQMVIHRLVEGNLEMIDECKDESCPYKREENFKKEIEYGFNNKLIDMNYSMYFYQLPKSKKIKSVFDTVVNNIILTDDTKRCLKEYKQIEKASEEEITKSLQTRIRKDANKDNSKDTFPDVVFKNQRIFKNAYINFNNQLINYVSSIRVKEQEKKVLNIIEELSHYQLDEAVEVVDTLINNVVENFKEEYENEEILQYRNKLVLKIKMYPEICKKLFNSEFPTITKIEMALIADINDILEYVNPDQINDELIENILQFNTQELKCINLTKFLVKCSNIDSKYFNAIFYGYEYNFNEREKYDLIQNLKIMNKLNLQTAKDYLKFFKHLEFIPAILEKDFLNLIKNSDERDSLENEYVDLIISTNQLSSEAMKYLDKTNTFYTLNEKLEKKLYKKGHYKLYVYSKSNRTKKFQLDEENMIDNLKSSYIYYFLNSNLMLKTTTISPDMAEFIKNNLNIENLPIERRCLLNILPQTLSDVSFILLNKDESYINEYLSNVKEFYKKDKNKIFELIYRLAYENCFLKEGTYYKLLKKFEKSKRNTFNKIKKNKKLKV